MKHQLNRRAGGYELSARNDPITRSPQATPKPIASQETTS